ncbi:MAG: inositol monophosphatase family protein [Pseudomonadota bacterium]
MQIDQSLQDELRGVARACADAARVETLRYFRGAGLLADDKDPGAGFDPVTQGDRAGEAAMRAVLAELRPGDGILGEEQAAIPSQTGLTWVLDPIDGTRGYLAGTPTWGTLIAVHAGGAPVYGIVDQPYIGERFEGGFGAAQWSRAGAARDLRTRQTVTLDQAILFTTFPEVGTADERRGFEAVAAQVLLTRYGMDCYAYALVAAGHADLVIEAGLQPYDIQGPMAVVEGAGGVVTAWDGGPAEGGGRVIAAANPVIHAAALALLAAAS